VIVMQKKSALSALLLLLGAVVPASAQDADELARQLSNPIASLISVPFQFNVDFGSGADGDAESYLLNIQPVIPVNLNADWNMISRTIVPVRFQDDLFEEDVFGLGDITQSIFFSPVAPGPGGLIWGVGPREMGGGPDGRCSRSEGQMDGRCACQPHLVLRR
jgi:hypothetical protein